MTLPDTIPNDTQPAEEDLDTAVAGEVHDHECGDPHCGDHELTMPFRRETPKVGRNDACPCGSGKKYKKCCLSAGA